MMRAKKRKMREPFSDRLFNFGNTVFMLLIMVVVIYPVLNVIAISFSNANHIARADVTVFPRGFTTTSYEYILKDQQVWTGYLNSVFYALGSTFVSLLCTSLFAYPLTHNDFVAKRFLTIFLTVTMFFGGGMIPTYLLMRNIGLIDNPLVLIVPFSVAAYNVFVFRTFFQNIPRELMESAEIDGANDFTILFRIILPLSKALLATFGLFGIVGSWNRIRICIRCSWCCGITCMCWTPQMCRRVREWAAHLSIPICCSKLRPRACGWPWWSLRCSRS